MNPARTISEQKADFIRSQIRLLSAPIEPAENWREYAWIPSKRRREDGGERSIDDGVEEREGETDEKRDIPDKIIADILGKFNSQLKQHNRYVFSSQATHHVSRQIGNLYWKQIKADAEMRELESRRSACEIEKGADLTSERNLLRLPEMPWSEGDEEVDRQTREKLDRHKTLRSLLKPFEKPLESIQPNLVTRDGALTGEIERMRMLVTKVLLKMERQAREGTLYQIGDADRDVEAMKTIGELLGEKEREKLKTVIGMP
ncbi:hypothetical protein KEM54_006526 [Ascosphaera aggregata]|nr:hypothetical protein KEM54_006526 [Ascosphaera aggregata]